MDVSDPSLSSPSSSFPGFAATSGWWRRSTHQRVRKEPSFALKAAEAQDWSAEGRSTLAVRALFYLMLQKDKMPRACDEAWGVWDQLVARGLLPAPSADTWVGEAWQAQAWLTTWARRHPGQAADGWVDHFVNRLMDDDAFCGKPGTLVRFFWSTQQAVWPLVLERVPLEYLTPEVRQEMSKRAASMPDLLAVMQERNLLPQDPLVLGAMAAKRHNVDMLLLLSDDEVLLRGEKQQTLAMQAVSALSTNRRSTRDEYMVEGKEFVPKSADEVADGVERLAVFLVALRRRGVDLDARVSSSRKKSDPHAPKGRLETRQCKRGETLWDQLRRRCAAYPDMPQGLAEQLQARVLALLVDDHAVPSRRRGPRL